VRKFIALLLIIIGCVMIIISILALIKAFDQFQHRVDGEAEHQYGYMFGSIFVPLLITVCGRWIYRKGKEHWKAPA
jgi:hypothetical protein